MKKFIVCLAVLMTAMMMGGSAWAFNETDHVKVAPNGKGDLIIFPYYVAQEQGWFTKITVINTSSTHSVVAKVVYRSFNWSFEVLDHLIFLSPNDVWTGTVEYDGIGKTARLKSTDDSILGRNPGPNFATEADFGNITKVDQPFQVPPCAAPTDSNTFGYIEVIESAARLESKAATGYEPGTRVAKKHIYDWYTKFVSTADLSGVYQPINVLTGYQECTFGVGSGATLKQAIVFADYDNRTLLDIGANTRLGIGARNTLSELEAAMGKLDIALPYIAKPGGDSSVHLFNFPTKLSWEPSGRTCSGLPGYIVNPRSPFWTSVNNKCESYTRNIYDLLENTPLPGAGEPFSPPKTPDTLVMCGEVEFNLQSIGDPSYTEGWIRYNFLHANARKDGLTQSGAPISYTGIPVLPSILYWAIDRGEPVDASGAYTDGSVSVANSALPYYQYSE